jgi:hypothetical protein
MGDMKRFPCEQYATLELNQVAFPKTGMVVSQTPLGDAFTADAPCENGMWVVADKAVGKINAPAAATDKPIGIVYTTEKEYDIMHYGLKTFGRKVAGDYPRVGILGIGDTVTTNCLQYDTTDYANDAALDTALKAIDTAEMYVGICAGSAVPQLFPKAKKPASGPVGKVVKYYTVPNGEKGVKYQIISL